MHEKAQESLQRLLELFSREEELPAAIAEATVIKRRDIGAPCEFWSLGNRLIMVSHGTSDARGFGQWKEVGRYPKKGSEVRSWRKATSYAERYLAKREEFPEGSETGRIWGVWNHELLPVQWETVRVSLRDAYRIRRIYRRLARLKGTGSVRRLTVFVRYENVIRLLRFLGYRLE
jgi:hypothetical protein